MSHERWDESYLPTRQTGCWDSDRLKAGIEMIAPPDPAKFEVCSAAPLPRRAVTSER